MEGIAVGVDSSNTSAAGRNYAAARPVEYVAPDAVAAYRASRRERLLA